jgi:hypothetical protein
MFLSQSLRPLCIFFVVPLELKYHELRITNYETMLHIPLLRAGKPYKSLDTAMLKHFRDSEPVAAVSQANRGLIAKDFSSAEGNRRRLHEIPAADLIAICQKAAEHFMHAELPLDGISQSPQNYVEQLSATTGMPHTLCRRNMAKLERVLKEMPVILRGLMRGLDPSILDSGWIEQDQSMLSFSCQAQALGAILPSNSPGVHSLWLPALPLKVPLVLKPGREEPWTPFRLAQAFMAAGCPPRLSVIIPPIIRAQRKFCCAVAVPCSSAINPAYKPGPMIRVWKFTGRAGAKSLLRKIKFTAGNNISI